MRASFALAAAAVVVATVAAAGGCERATTTTIAPGAPPDGTAPAPTPTGSTTATTATATTTATTAAATHRERARVLLEEHCGLCHLPPDVGGGSGMALHIYDLTQPDWSATLSDAQLPIVEQKLADDGATKDEVAVITKFVADELAWRDAHPSAYSRALRDAPPHGP